MRKTFKISGTVALVAVIGFLMTACSGGDSEDGPEEPKTFISVTDIPSSYNNMVGALVLSTPGSDIAVYSTEEKISGNSTTFPLFNWADETPWIGSGVYNITILISRNNSEAAAKKYVYAGVTTEASITDTTTIIAWSSFTEKPAPNLNLLPAYFQKKTRVK